MWVSLKEPRNSSNKLDLPREKNTASEFTLSTKLENLDHQILLHGLLPNQENVRHMYKINNTKFP